MSHVNVNFQTTLWFRFKLTLVTLKLLQRAAARSFFDILFFFFLFAEVDVEEEGAVGLIDCSTALQSIKCKLKCTWFSFVWENPKILTFLCKPTKISETQLGDKLTMRDFKNQTIQKSAAFLWRQPFCRKRRKTEFLEASRAASHLKIEFFEGSLDIFVNSDHFKVAQRRKVRGAKTKPDNCFTCRKYVVCVWKIILVYGLGEIWAQFRFSALETLRYKPVIFIFSHFPG